ncbi:MAG: hypothetical protein JST49_15800 [Bacteroidetes bacterium]|nr:hypothetical protein [Bacteroidota bacterium]
MKAVSNLFIPWLALLALLLNGCGKEQTAIGDAPNIEFVSISPNPAIKYQDEVAVTIKYTDGNGDLGENTPDMKNAFITDSRNNVTYQFRIPQQAPDDANIIITGQLTFLLAPQGFVDDNNTSETTKYTIHIVDRAGNESNTVETSTLTINK